jgi:hypothetical protein
MNLSTTLILSLAFLLGASAEQCGSEAGGAVCANGECCSKYGWCGTTPEYCETDCQSNCKTAGTPTPSLSATPTSGVDVSSIISSTLFDRMLKYHNDPLCKSNGFYTYNAFITAARSFPGFGTSVDVNTRKREIAAFLAQTSHETTGEKTNFLFFIFIFWINLLNLIVKDD